MKKGFADERRPNDGPERNSNLRQAAEELQRRTEQLEALAQATQMAASSLDLNRILETVVALAGKVTDSDYVSLAIMSEDGKRLRNAEIKADLPNLEQRLRPEEHTEWVLRSRRAVVVDDLGGDGSVIHQEPGEAPGAVDCRLAEFGVRSFVGLPLPSRVRPLGTLFLYSLRPGNFRGQLSLLTAFASQAAIVIENARLYRANQEQSLRLATINTIGAAAVSAPEVETALNLIVEMTCQALDADEGSILTGEPETDGLTFELDTADIAQTMYGQQLAPGQGIAGWVAQQGRSVRVNDVRRDPRFYSGVDTTTGFETRSLMCAPLRYRGKVTGVIEIVNKRQGEFNDEDLSLLETVSSIASAILENAYLHKATNARANELALLNEIGVALTSTLEFSAVAQAVLNQVQSIFRAENVSLLQVSQQTGEMYFVKSLYEKEPVEISTRLRPGEGIAGWALEQRQAVLVKDAQNDLRFSNRVDKQLGRDTRALMAVPLMTPGRAIGVIEVVSSRPNTYTLDDLRTLQALSTTLAIALENARMYDELKTLLGEWETTPNAA